MGWEKRDRGGLYYTRTRKIGGRIVREYLGSGPLAELAALMDAHKRLRRQEEAKAWQEERKRMEALKAPVEELCEATDVLLQAHLVACSYRRVAGNWRRRRESA